MTENDQIKSDLVALLKWFEDRYSPEDKAENGKPKGVSGVISGKKGNVVIMMYYDKPKP